MAEKKTENLPYFTQMIDNDEKYNSLSIQVANLQKETSAIKEDLDSIKELLQKIYYKEISERGWNPSGKQLQLIEYLARNNGEAKMKDLSKDNPGAGMVESTVSQIVRSLVSRNIIMKVPDAEDPSSRYKLRLNMVELSNNFDNLPSFIQRIISKKKDDE